MAAPVEVKFPASRVTVNTLLAKAPPAAMAVPPTVMLSTRVAMAPPSATWTISSQVMVMVLFPVDAYVVQVGFVVSATTV